MIVRLNTNGDLAMSVATSTDTYWNSKGTHQHFADELAKLVPAMGEVPAGNPMLEKFRKASNCYYDLYNNGLCNRAKEFWRVFGIRSSEYKLNTNPRFGSRFHPELYQMLEAKMDAIILDAVAEQKIV